MTVDLSGLELFVARAFSPKLIQINFGFNSAHFSNLDLDISEHSLKMPHYFA